MEIASSAATTRGFPLQKEWRAVSDPQNAGDATGYVNGREPDGFSDSELQQQILTVSRQQGELEQLEVELRAQLIARHEMVEIQSTYESQFTEYANAAARMQEQLHDKDRELHAIKLDNETAWAKQGILREQNKQLATFRRERDLSEAERSQNIHKISELQDLIQEKETQFTELQEQNRIAQETIMYKDEQLRDAQIWISRAQEMDALHSSTNLSLQAELRERTEQYNQLWLGCQRQFAEMERLHLRTVQQLQLELTNVREGGGSCSGETHTSNTNSNGASQIIQNNNKQIEAHGNSAASANVNVHSNGKSSDNISSFTSSDMAAQNNRFDGLSSSHLGMHGYLQAGQMTPMHSLVMHQQEIPQVFQTRGLSPQVAQSVLLQQKAVQDSSQMPLQNHAPSSQGVHGLVSSDAKTEYQVSANGQSFGQGYLDVLNRQGAQYGSTTQSSSVTELAVKSGNEDYIGSNHLENKFQDILSQFCDAPRLDSHILNQKPEANGQVSAGEQNGAESIVPETLVSSGKAERNSESALLDERLLLACMVRTIPAGGRIKISSTLPNRLGKMLAPLHWHDYKKKYGKLEDFVASHVELFVIEDEYIQVREGAQKMVAASAALAKVAAAAAALSSPNSMYVAMTPMAQSQKNDKTVQRCGQSSDPMAKQQRKL